MKCCKITIAGRVQGVFFRGGSKSMARYLGIKGFVKNLTDGKVYIEAEGPDVQLRDFIKWCHQGPPNAYVENVEIEYTEIKNFETFSIRY